MSTVIETNSDQKSNKTLYIGDAWLKYELSDVHLSFGQFVRKLEDEGYNIVMKEDQV